MGGYRYRGAGGVPKYRVVEPVPAPVPDLPGRPIKPKPDKIQTVDGFVWELNWLRDWAGLPSYRELSERCGGRPSASSFGAMLRSKELPRLDMLQVFIESLGLPEDVDAWLNACRRLRKEQNDNAT